jgi:membrane peptidoglycan carboxypeptidase
VFEATPYEIATAYTLFPNGGIMRPLQHITRSPRRQGRDQKDTASRATVARPDTTFLVTNMMRSVLNEGTGAARARPASRSTPPARPARPTICATRGSSASRPSC